MFARWVECEAAKQAVEQALSEAHQQLDARKRFSCAHKMHWLLSFRQTVTNG
jgi:hypothetical protein